MPPLKRAASCEGAALSFLWPGVESIAVSSNEPDRRRFTWELVEMAQSANAPWRSS